MMFKTGSALPDVTPSTSAARVIKLLRPITMLGLQG
jgi:hypothetical protein